MIVVMKQEATETDVKQMVKRIESLGLKAHVIVGTERTVIAAVGDDRKTHKESLESGPGVAEVLPILALYKIASLELKREPTTSCAPETSRSAGNWHHRRDCRPCSVEAEEQILATAKASSRPPTASALRRRGLQGRRTEPL